MSELPLMAAGWDEAVQVAQEREARRHAPPPQGGQRIYGMGGGGMNG